MKRAALLMGLGIGLLSCFMAGAILDLPGTRPAYAQEAGEKPDSAAHPASPHAEKEGEEAEEDAILLSKEEQQRFGIQVAQAGPGKLLNYLELQGEVSINNDRLAHVVPRLSGVVREVRKSVGDVVRQGEILAVIESRELADVQAEYLAAIEKLALAQAKYVREERLWQKKISAEQDYLDAKQAVAESNIATRAARQKLHSLGLAEEYIRLLPKRQAGASYTRFEIVAPFDGSIIEKHITLGETLKEDTDAFMIADLSTLWVNFNIYPKDLQHIRQGQEIFIATGQDTPDVENTIAYIAPVVKEETRTALARVILPNPAGLWRAGMFVTARVVVGEGEEAALVVPKTALQTVEEKTMVFVATPQGFEAEPVQVGRSNATHVEITSGLSAGATYALTGTFTLKAQLSKSAFGDGHGH